MDKQTLYEVLQNAVVPGMYALLLAAGVALAREYVRHLRKHRTDAALCELVQAAEQLYGAGKGEVKRRYVREKASENGMAVTREAIEAAVYELKH